MKKSFNRQIIEAGNIQAFLLKSGEAELVVWLQASPLGEISHLCTRSMIYIIV